MTVALAAALTAVRAWTRIYTARLPPAIRDARRNEIESDLWELHEDVRRRGGSPARIAIHMLLRLVFGAGDDLLWRAEQQEAPARVVRDALWAGAAASLVFVWWLASALQAVDRYRPVDGINVIRLLYPVQPVARVPPLPVAPPLAAVKLQGAAHCRIPDSTR